MLQRLDAPYLIIDVDRQKAASVGLTPKEVIEQAVAALNSSISIDRNFWIDVKTGNQYFVAVQYPDNPAMKLDDVLNIEATGAKQSTPVKLSSLARFRRTYLAVEINHVNLMPIFNVQVNTEGRDIAGVASDIEDSHQGHPRQAPRGHVHHLQGRIRAHERIVLTTWSPGWPWPSFWSTCFRWRCSAPGSARSSSCARCHWA